MRFRCPPTHPETPVATQLPPGPRPVVYKNHDPVTAACNRANGRARLMHEVPVPVIQPAKGAGRILGNERPDPAVEFDSPLVTRNVTVSGRRTSVRLEPDLWEALREIALRENRTLHDICSDIDKTRGGTRLTSAMRIYIVNYFRSAANPS